MSDARSSNRWVPAAILALALALRVAGLDFGLPLAEARPDEMTIAFQAMKFGTGDLNPHSFNYPSLFKYVVFAIFGAYYVVGRVLGEFSGQEDFLRTFFSGAVTFRLLMRAWSVVAGVGAVALLLRSPGGRWGAALLAVCFLHVRDSHFGVTDATMTTLCVAAVVASLRLADKGTTGAALLAGALAGLATSTKYNAALLALPVALGAWASPGATVPLVATGAAAMVGAFVAGSPYALLDFATFRKDFLYEVSHLSTGHFVDVGNGWVHHLTRSLRYGLGVPLLVGGIGGLALGAVRDGRRGLVLVAFPLAYYAAIGRGETAFFRYMLPVVPFLCMGAGVLLEAAARVRGRALAGALAAAMALPTLNAAVQADRLMLAGDTRDAMGRWIEANVPADAVLVHAGAYTGAPMLQRNVVNQTREFDAKAGRADASGFRKPDDPRWYDPTRPAYDVLFVRKPGIDFASQVDVDALVADPPEWLLVEDYFLVHYSAVPDAVRALAAARYEVVREESALDGPVRAPVFDQQDAFYLPAAGFSGFARMGPTLRLYRLRAPVPP